MHMAELLGDEGRWDCKSSEHCARDAEALKCSIFTGLLSRALTRSDLHLQSFTEAVQTVVWQVT